jgi:DnaJ-class molecular chaperone
LFQRAELYKQLGYFQEAVTDYQKINNFDVKPLILEAQRKLLEAMRTKCHYKVLGIPTDASSEDIKKAYRVMAR